MSEKISLDSSVDYAQFKDMTDYVESSIKLSLKQVFTDGITLKGHTIKL